MLAQLDWPDTVPLAMRALEAGEVDVFLDFALWSICREHADRWVSRAETGTVFANLRQLQFAGRALKQAVGIGAVIRALGAGELGGAELTGAIDWIANVGDPDHLEALFELALEEGAAAERQAMVLKGLGEAVRLRKQQPAGDRNRLVRFLNAKEDAVFAAAAVLAGQWKLEPARGALEKAFLSADREAAR
ncbi:MAG: hypothetical protein GWN54_00280, partial [Gammaproteobacteria bacterium]|nr:hypothetical protein [Gammaproteobacteria bacterium]